MALRGAVYVNGVIKPAGEAVVPVYDHGFLYGEGVYETLRTYNRVPFLYDRHQRRLRASANRIHLNVPFTDAQLGASIDETVNAAGDMKEAYIRVLLTRGVGELITIRARLPIPRSSSSSSRSTSRRRASSRTASTSASSTSCAITPDR